MRYIEKTKVKPNVGDRRVKTVFLMIPRKIGKEWRWLEKATWLEEFIIEPASWGHSRVVYWKPIEWM